MGDFMPIIYINYNLYYYGGFRAPNCLMTFVTHDTRDLPPPEKKSKKVGELFEDRNTNVVTLHHQPEAQSTPPAAQPDTRTGKPNTGAYKPNTDAYKAINGASAESWYAAYC